VNEVIVALSNNEVQCYDIGMVEYIYSLLKIDSDNAMVLYILFMYILFMCHFKKE